MNPIIKRLKDFPGRIKYTVRSKLIAIFTLLVALIAVFIYLYFPLELERQALTLAAEKAHSIAGMAAVNISSTLVFEDKRDMENILQNVLRNRDVAYLVIHNSRGDVFFEYKRKAALKVDYEVKPGKRPVTADGLIFRSTAPIVHNRRDIGRLFMGLSLKVIRAQVERSRGAVALVSAIVFALAVTAVFLISTVITNPLKKMVRTMEQISGGDLSRRITLWSNDELGHLAVSFNRMVAGLEAYSVELKELNTNLESKVEERTRKLRVEIGERRLAQESLEKSKESYRRLVDNPLVGIYITHEGRFRFCNQRFSEIFGFSSPWELVDTPIKDRLTPESRLQMEQGNRRWKAGDNPTRRYELRGIKKDGAVFDIEMLDKPVLHEDEPAIEGIVLDITLRKEVEAEREKLESQLRQAQKIESLGALAGGIAHDFNNILGAVMGYTELTMVELPEDGKAWSNLQRVYEASTRAREMVKQILAFSRKGEVERRPIQLHEIVDEVLKLMRSTLPSTIEILPEIAVMTHPILADKSEFHQVIMNLCTNAGHAMRENGGTLRVILEEIVIPKNSRDVGELEPGPYQQLTVGDTGSGMPPAVRERIFEPYFTTKREGEGTGMGLAMVHGIIKGCGGDITVESEPGKGTTFRILLPSVPAGEFETEAETVLPAPVGNEHILYVDDEAVLAELGSTMLQRLGYEVTMRTAGADALDTFIQNPHRFDLVITDQTMPFKTGVQLAREIKEIRPDIPVILCSGFSESVNEENYRDFGMEAFLMKPVVRGELFRVVRRVLDARASQR